jgi:S1-C subfamily serine protease
MKRLFTAMLTLFCGVAFSADFSIIRKYSRPILVTLTLDERTSAMVGNGSGIAIAEGYLLSVAHVVEKPPNHKLVTSVGTKAVELRVVKVDPKTDLALLASPDIKCPCATLTSDVVQDEDAWTVGFPKYGTFQTQFVTTGLIQNYVHGSIIATPNAAPGSSGGGLFVKRDKQYLLGGIVKAIGHAPNGPVALNIGQEYQWITISAPGDVIKAFLKGTPAEIK